MRLKPQIWGPPTTFLRPSSHLVPSSSRALCLFKHLTLYLHFFFVTALREMTIYNLYFFNRHGVCLAYKEWCREKKSGISQDEEFKLVNGMLLSLRSFSHKLATRADQTPMIQCFRTSSYKMNYMETATGLRMILNTDPDAVSISELMQSIFCIFVETVLQNPFVDTSKRIDSELFLKRVDDLVRSHFCFT